MKAILIILLTMSTFAQGQIDKNAELFIILKKQDSIFFERGFNQCDIDYLDKTIADDLKFYHDQGGLQNRKQFFENTKKYICSKLEKNQ